MLNLFHHGNPLLYISLSFKSHNSLHSTQAIKLSRTSFTKHGSMSQKLTDEQLKELRDVFEIFDKDDSGTISADELRETCRMLKLNMSDKKFNEMMKQMDVDSDGKIDFNEFVRVVGEHLFREHSDEELRQVFRYFDEDGSGEISVSELRNVFAKLGKAHSEAEIRCMIREIDKDGSDQISFEEFVQLLK